MGTGEDITITDLARLIAQVIGYRGELVFDTSRPDGTPRKLLNISKLRALGWKARHHLPSALSEVMQTFLRGMGATGDAIKGFRLFLTARDGRERACSASNCW